MSQLPPPPPDLPSPPSGQPPDGGSAAPPEARRVPWGIPEAILMIPMAFVVGSLLAGIVLALTGTVDECGPSYVLGLVVAELGYALTVAFWVTVVRKAPLSILGAPKEPVKDVVTGLVGGAALYAIAIGVSVVVYALVSAVLGHAPDRPDQVKDCVSGIWLALSLPAAAIAAPIGEETVFRGFVLQGFRNRFTMWPSAVFSGILFGLVHIPFWLLVPSLAVVGIGLGYIYQRRQSLLASMTAHATFNLIGILLIYASRR